MPVAREFMNTDLISVDPCDSVEAAISLMLQHSLSGLPVVDSIGRLLGFISEFDLLELVWDPETRQNKVYHYMTREIQKVDENTSLDDVAERFRILSIRRLPVMRGARIVGMISRSDLLAYVLQARGEAVPVVPCTLSPVSSAMPSPAA